MHSCTLAFSVTVQEVTQEMMQQLQHIQHADQNLSAEELKYSTFQLVQALKVQTY